MSYSFWPFIVMIWRLKKQIEPLLGTLTHSIWSKRTYSQLPHLMVSFRLSVGRWQTWMNNNCRNTGARPELQGARGRPRPRPPPACLPAWLPAWIFRFRSSSRRRAVPGWRVHGAGSPADDAGPMSESNFILQRGESDMLHYWNRRGDPKKACQ